MNERIKLLLEEMEKQGVEACIIPTSDCHLSEYTPECFKLRHWLTGFTGSAGTLVVTKERAGLWTDGRYYLQAEKELSGSDIELFYASEKECMKPEEFLIENTAEASVVGICGRLFSKKELDEIIDALKEKNISVKSEFNPFVIWKERPQFPDSKAFLTDGFCGETTASKLLRIREKMKEDGVTHYISAMADAVMWVLNVRGGDIEYTPVILSYLLIGSDFVNFYADEKKFSNEIKAYLKKCEVTLCGYEKIYDDIRLLKESGCLAADFSKTNYSLLCGVKCNLKNIDDYIGKEKCIRNKTEAENIKKAYIKENIALIKSFYEIYNTSKALDECDVCDIIEKHRKENEGYIEPSFSTIAAYGKNAVIIHYSPEKGKCSEVKKEGMLLIDTGGQYTEGTTDTTRTLILGEIPEETAENYTLVLKGMLKLSSAEFLKGTCGRDIDICARGSLLKKGLNYRHGTGHGVGYMLCVHEGPQAISPRSEVALEEGMTITDEPGIYISNEYGVRIENHLLVKEKRKTEYGTFLGFEILNYCPIGTKGIRAGILSEEEKVHLNDYNKKVKELYKEKLSENEYKWLLEYIKEI